MDDLIAKVEKKYIKEQVTDMQPGDTVRVRTRITEGEGKDQRTRMQTFEGVVIARRGGGVNESITVRRMSFGIGVERTFPLHSPLVEDIEVVRRGDVRRAKLYYLRQRRGRAARVKEKARVHEQSAPEAEQGVVPQPQEEAAGQEIATEDEAADTTSNSEAEEQTE